MLALFGKISLLFALFFSFLQGALPLWGHFRKNSYAYAFARPSLIGQSIFVLLAYTLLTFAFATDDFSLAYVAANSHASLPLMYKLTAVWGAHEGSILFWILILALWSITFLFFERRNTLLPLTLAILGVISFSFLCFLLLTSNPFLQATASQTGQDLNPLLQDPGFVIHPPMLYTGYVGFSVAFAITQAALIRGRLDAEWAKVTRQFALGAWCFLTLGIALGSWWAYRVLGWGGFWFWDPVENASLLPWLSGTALIHVLLLVEKRQTAKGWATLLAMMTFALSLLGTFLVRSGVLISAHTFANDPLRGVFLLLLLGILTLAATALYLSRIPLFTTQSNAKFSLYSREIALLLNSMLLFIAMLTILLGTLYPLILDAFRLGTISVGAPYFNKVMAPLTLIILTAMALASFTYWQEPAHNAFPWLSVGKKLVLSFVLALLALLFLADHLDGSALLTLTLCFWIVLSLLSFASRKPGMTFAHLGFAITVIGIMLSSSLNQEREVRLKPGENVAVGPYQFNFIETSGITGPNFRGISAHFAVSKKARPIADLFPEKRVFIVRDMVMTKVAIHASLFRDLYLALGEPLDQDYWSVRIYYKPFIRFIWFGGVMMIVGGLLAIRERKHASYKKN